MGSEGQPLLCEHLRCKIQIPIRVSGRVKIDADPRVLYLGIWETRAVW